MIVAWKWSQELYTESLGSTSCPAGSFVAVSAAPSSKMMGLHKHCDSHAHSQETSPHINFTKHFCV